uniref:ORF2 protein n=1 Tax=Barramundi calicivirus 1 TaxID=3162777 RepID=A0AAU7P163_9CALI
MALLGALAIGGELLSSAANIGSAIGSAKIHANTQKELQLRDQDFQLNLLGQHRAALGKSGLPDYLAYGSGSMAGRSNPYLVQQSYGLHTYSGGTALTNALLMQDNNSFGRQQKSNGRNVSGFRNNSMTSSRNPFGNGNFSNPNYKGNYELGDYKWQTRSFSDPNPGQNKPIVFNLGNTGSSYA